MFDLDANLKADNAARPGLGAPRCSRRKPRFPPYQAGLEAYTTEIDDSIEDTHLQYDLKKHPSALVRKGQVCSSFPSIYRFGIYILRVLTDSFSLILNTGC